MNFFKFLILFNLSFLFFGCLNSPILNHSNATEITSSELANKDCPFEFKKSNLCADIQWIKMPKDEEMGEFLIKFFKYGDSPTTGPFIEPGYTIGSKLWMPSMGHGSSPVSISPFKDETGKNVIGIFDVKNVYFTMPGIWNIWIYLKQDTSKIDEAFIEISIK